MQTPVPSPPASASPQCILHEGDIKASLTQLRAQIQQSQDGLLKLSTTTIPCDLTHKSLQATLTVAKSARDNCRTLRSNLTSLSACYKTLQLSHSEIRRRQHLLHTLKSTLEHLHRIHLLSKTIESAHNDADHAQLSRACILFESLTSSHPLFNSDYTCLHPISDRVSLAVAQSMRSLRTSLRSSCRNFDPVVYSKCIFEFDKLGARKQFAQHVLQAFEEESKAAYDDADALEARASHRILSAFSMLSGLVEQFCSVIEYHGVMDGEGGEQVRREVGVEILQGILPLEMFARLAGRLFGELRIALLAEQTTVLLYVFTAATQFRNAIVASSVLGAAVLERLMMEHNPRKGLVNVGTRLRRKGSNSRLDRGGSKIQKRRSARLLEGKPVEEEFGKVIKGVALDYLSLCHFRHAEELQMITESPESWIRIRMTEGDIRSLFRDLFSGVDGKIADVGRDRSEKKEWTEPEFEEINCGSITFTTASLAMLRWVSEYATIGVTVPDVLSDCLSNITDIFLILVHASIDMKSRVQTSQSEPFLRVFEDLLLERPRDKTIGDFIPIGAKQTFEVFLARYGSVGSREAEEADIGQSEERWGRPALTPIPLYSNAAGHLFASESICTLSIVRQCVAAEGIATFCDVLARFSAYLEEISDHNGKLKDSSGPLKMGSLKSAIFLGRAVQQSFYDLLAWDIIGGWQAISAVAETCRSFHHLRESEKDEMASKASPFVHEMLSRIKTAYSVYNLPPTAAERISVVVCETAMTIILEGFSRVQHCSSTASVSQILVDLRSLDLGLVDLTGLHPCPGRARTEMYIKATFLNEDEVTIWAQRNRRKLNLSDDHIKALVIGCRRDEIPVVDQIITL